MPALSLNSSVRRIRRIAYIIQSIEGLTLGVEIFVWGPLFYGMFEKVSTPEVSISLTATLIATVNISRIFLEVPTGAIGDAIGRKKAVALSYAFKMLCLLCLVAATFAQSVTQIMFCGVGYAITYAVAYTFFSGTFSAWCVDKIRDSGSPVGYEAILAPAHAMKYVGIMSGGVCGIYLFTQSLAAYVFLGGAIVCAIAVVFVLGEMESEESIEFVSISDITVGSLFARMREIIASAFLLFRKSPAILAAVCVYASFMVVVNVMDYFWPIYVQNNVVGDVRTYIWMAMAAVTSFASVAGSQGLAFVTRVIGYKLENQTLRRIFIGGALSIVVPVCVLSWQTYTGNDSILLLASVVLLVLCVHGVLAPCFDTLINNYVPDSHAGERATVLSFGSLLRSLLMVVLAVPAGGASGEDTTVGWAIPAILLFAMALFGNRIMKRAGSAKLNANVVNT